jgi:gliding motility-associated-like protein
MEKWHNFILILIIVTLNMSGANTNLINLGFEKGTFSGWTGYTRIYSTDVPSNNTSWVEVTLPTSRRQVIMTDTTAYDPTVGNLLKIIPKGYKYSARLGDVITSADVTQGNNMGFRCWQQKLQYKLAVDSTNSLLIMKFACVLQYASDHTALMEPRFKLTLYDSSGNEINTCTNYDVYSSSSLVTGFKTYTSTNSLFSSASNIQWRDWTTVGADLSAYKGQNITLEFMSADCTGRFHFGYAYFVADYQPMKISTNFCGTSDTAKLIAPTGFESYRWRDMGSGSIVNSDTTLSTISVPMVNKDSVIYHCIMRSATGCIDSLSTTILKYKPVASFAAKMVGSCTADSVQFTNNSSTNRGKLSYLWDYGDGTTDTISSKVHLHHYTTSGHHTATLTVYNPPSTCTIDTVKDVESIDVDMVGLKAGKDSICIGSSTGTLIANGAWSYKWSIDSTTTKLDTASIKTGLPANTYWVIGYNSAYNCFSKKHYATISDESEWMDSIQGKCWFCAQDSTQLNASGWYVNANQLIGAAKQSLSYLWSNGATTDTVFIGKPGTYTVTATDPWGCSRSTAVNVSEKALPLTDFSVSPLVINPKHNEVICSITQQSNVIYSWNFGDNTTLVSGNPVSHLYSQSLPTARYLIALKDSDTVYGCTNSATKSIVMEPFIPNVFTPNGDGHNDYFMPYYDMKIYDRYGILLYTGTTTTIGWDGTYKGKKVDPDTYFYVIHYTDFNNQTQTRKGYITLIR